MRWMGREAQFSLLTEEDKVEKNTSSMVHGHFFSGSHSGNISPFITFHGSG
jgi:hypothetical protein